MRRVRILGAAVVAFAAAAAPARAGEPRRADASSSARLEASAEIDLVPMPPSAQERLDAIRQRVQEAVRYPQAARERGIQGVARIQFRIDAEGRAAGVITVESSGSGLLDAAAEDAARNARELPQLYGWVLVPVRFELAPRVASAR